MRKLFGTDGIRGEANAWPLDPNSLVRLGQAIAKHFLTDSERHTILIGKDTRLSGYMIEYSLAAGLTSAGANVYLTGPIPTAAIAYLTQSLRIDAGIMVSASHNPYEDNGIKIFASNGYKLPDRVEDEIVALFESDENLAGDVRSSQLGRIKRLDDARGRYIVFLKNCLPRELTLKGLRIGLDCANGAAYQVAPAVFDELGAEVVTRGVSPSGKNINSGFGSLYPEVVSKLVIEHNLDVGFAFDGDSDRLVVIDDQGSIFSGDHLLALLAKYYLDQNNLNDQTLVTTVMSNLALDNYLTGFGAKVVRAQVGDRYVMDQLLEHKLNLGGEESGHVILHDQETCGDGIMTALKVLEVMLRSGQPLSKLLNEFELYPRKLINLKVKDKPELGSLEGYQDLYEEQEKKLADQGRILIRYSGTENKIRILVEAQDSKLCNSVADRFNDFFQHNIGAA